MLLALDIGNTNVTAGRFEGAELLAVVKVPRDSLVSADLTSAFGLSGVALGPEDRVAISSVNPSAAEAVLSWARQLFTAEPLVAGKNLPVRIPDAVVERQRVGVDRLLAALAGYHRTRSACIVVDLGSAITIDAVSARGVFLGGIILPGLRMAARALSRDTAFLPEVELDFPESVLGRDTVSAIQSGLLWGWVEMVRGLTERLKAEVGQKVHVLLTGGDAELLGPHLGLAHETVPCLTLHGLQLAVEGYSTQGGRR